MMAYTCRLAECYWALIVVELAIMSFCTAIIAFTEISSNGIDQSCYLGR